MDIVNLPTDNAHEPLEGAQQSPVITSAVDQELASRKRQISFVNDTEDTIESNRSYKNILSQPLKELSHKQKLLWLQKRRTLGLWVQCDDCDRWRYLDHILDSYDLPKKWYCHMNPDANFASCAIPETPMRVHDEEKLIHSKYSAGSIVWARLAGWPWWPAMIDDCPDLEEFYYLDGFSDIPTDFHVVFFDDEVSRAWLPLDRIKHYKNNKSNLKGIKYQHKKRLQKAIAQANDALSLPLTERFAKYSFVTRYEGVICTPKKVTKSQLKKYQDQFKKKFNIDFDIECSDDSYTYVQL